MSRLSLKKDFKDGTVLYGEQINTNNKATELAVNDNFDKIQNLQTLKADISDVTDKLATKVDNATFNNAIDSLETTKANRSELNLKADKSEVNLKADTTYVNEQLATKVDTSTYTSGLAAKADKNYVDTSLSLKADKTELAAKADKNDVNTSLESKADLSYVNNQLATKADNSQVSLKADKTYVDSQLSSKTDKTYVDNQLANKANKTDLETKADKSVVGDIEDLKSPADSLVDAINNIQIDSIPIATTETVGAVKPDGTTITVDADGTIHSIGGGGTGGTPDYNGLDNKPQVNDVTLTGNKTANELGLVDEVTFNSSISSKADLGYVNGQLDLKADKTELSSKADTSYVDSKLADKVDTSTYTSEMSLKADKTELSSKADTSYVNGQLANKVDTETYNAGLATKADKLDTYTKEEVNTAITNSVANKVDKSYVDTQLSSKADKTDTYTKTEVDTAIETATSGIDTKLATKANASDVYTKSDTDSKISEATSTKADTTYVNEQLALKSDKADTYTKDEVDNLVDNQIVVGDTLPIGAMIPFSGQTTPENWLLCDGKEVSRTTYSQLFEVIGTIYGEGDGTTSFNLPDLRDTIPMGVSDDVTLGTKVGANEKTLEVANIPTHTHTVGTSPQNSAGSYTVALNGKGYSNNVQIQTSSAGEGKPFDNRQQSLGQYYIIKAKQSSGVVATVVDTLESSSATDALSSNMGKKLNNKFLTKLWENPNMNNGYTTGTIELSSDDYDYLIWICEGYNGWKRMLSYISPKGFVPELFYAGSAQMSDDINWRIGNYTRKVTRVDDKHYQIDNVGLNIPNGDSYSNNGIANGMWIIPRYIYGGKFSG